MLAVHCWVLCYINSAYSLTTASIMHQNMSLGLMHQQKLHHRHLTVLQTVAGSCNIRSCIGLKLQCMLGCKSPASYLITLILEGKGIAKANPGSCKAVLYGCGLAKVPPGAIILLSTQVVAANSKPGKRSLWVLLHKSA